MISNDNDLNVNTDFSLKILFGTDYGLKDIDLLETISTGIFGRTRLVRSLKDKTYYSLKIMNKSKIVKSKQLLHVQNEVKILSRIRSIFVIEMKALFQDENCLYLLSDYIPGGEIYSHLRRNKTFELSAYQFYTVEIACALYSLHQLNIVYRDLKPENVLLTKEGHVRLTEFGLAKVLDHNTNNTQTFTLCGTPEYIAPEVINNLGYGTTIDWWALGIFLYEMVMGFPPFFGKTPFVVYKMILEGKVKFDSSVSTSSSVPITTQSCIIGLLERNRRNRLGCNSFDSIQKHLFFKGIDWKSAIQELLLPPFVPTITSIADSSNYDYYPEDLIQESSNLTQEERKLFNAFDEILDRPQQSI